MFDNVYFYSKGDEYSMYLLRKIINHPLRPNFNFFCIDGIINLPMYIQYVPSLKVYIENEKFQIVIGNEIEKLLDPEEEEDLITSIPSEAEKLLEKKQSGNKIKYSKKEFEKKFDESPCDEKDIRGKKLLSSIFGNVSSNSNIRNELLPDNNNNGFYLQDFDDDNQTIMADDGKINEKSDELNRLMDEKRREREMFDEMTKKQNAPHALMHQEI